VVCQNPVVVAVGYVTINGGKTAMKRFEMQSEKRKKRLKSRFDLKIVGLEKRSGCADKRKRSDRDESRNAAYQIRKRSEGRQTLMMMTMKLMKSKSESDVEIGTENCEKRCVESK
jgi:hypothetical protein